MLRGPEYPTPNTHYLRRLLVILLQRPLHRLLIPFGFAGRPVDGVALALLLLLVFESRIFFNSGHASCGTQEEYHAEKTVDSGW